MAKAVNHEPTPKSLRPGACAQEPAPRSMDLYILDGLCVVPSQNSEDRQKGPLWGP